MSSVDRGSLAAGAHGGHAWLGWDEVPDLIDWTAIGAMATGASMIFIGWKAWETRKTADSGRDAVKASRDGVEVARTSVEISQSLAIDSTKARLDARAPRLLVAAASTEHEVAYGGLHNGMDQPWPRDREFRRSQDDGQTLVMGTQIGITNEGDRSVRVSVDGTVWFLRPEQPNVHTEGGRATVPLGPGERCEFRLYGGRTLKEWAEAWEALRTGEDVSRFSVRGQVICSDPYDS